jgi:hypothetical protein
MNRTHLTLAPYGLTMRVRDLHPRYESNKLIVPKMRWACGGLLDTNLGVRIYANITDSSPFPRQKMTGTTGMRYMPCWLTTEFPVLILCLNADVGLCSRVDLLCSALRASNQHFR